MTTLVNSSLTSINLEITCLKTQRTQRRLGVADAHVRTKAMEWSRQFGPMTRGCCIGRQPDDASAAVAGLLSGQTGADQRDNEGDDDDGG